MSYFSEQDIDTRTCGQADEDAYLDRRDGLTTSRYTRPAILAGLEAQRHNASYAARPLAYLSHGARFERMIQRYTTARAEGRMQAAAAIKRAARRIVDEMPI
jgi:hypothetical protein